MLTHAHNLILGNFYQFIYQTRNSFLFKLWKNYRNGRYLERKDKAMTKIETEDQSRKGK